jgi:hypothetical protein
MLHERANKFQQSQALLNLDYPRYFPEGEVYHDPFLCIEPLFRFAASSESQFLNMLENTLEGNMRLYPSNGNQGLPADTSVQNLHHHLQMLCRHQSHIVDALDCIRQRGGPDWPQSGSAMVSPSSQLLDLEQKFLFDNSNCTLTVLH